MGFANGYSCSLGAGFKFLAEKLWKLGAPFLLGTDHPVGPPGPPIRPTHYAILCR